MEAVVPLAGADRADKEALAERARGKDPRVAEDRRKVRDLADRAPVATKR